MINGETVGEYIQRMRDTKGICTKALSLRCGLGYLHVCQIEDDLDRPDIFTLNRILLALSVPRKERGKAAKALLYG